MSTGQLSLAADVRGAVLSECGTYRYTLGRQWGPGEPMVFVMLNPSTADAETDDQTIGRCIGFARREGYGGIHVVNLFAYRATEPDELLRNPVDVVGPENYRHLQEAGAMVRRGGIAIAAWGSHRAASRRQIVWARCALRCPLSCLGVTKYGAPRHPSRLSGRAHLVPYSQWATS